MTKEHAKRRIEKLRDEINHHRYLYAVLDRQEISDAALDSLKHELFTLEEQFPDLVTTDSPTQRVAGKPLDELKKVLHAKPMLSIEDVFTQEELGAWKTRLERIIGEPLDTAAGGYYAEIKMDGLAVSLVYKNRILVSGSTRGDGVTGEDITHNIKSIEAIPLRLRNPTPPLSPPFKGGERGGLRGGRDIFHGTIEIRGEVFLTKKAFIALNEEQKIKGLPPFANPRNVAAGTLRQLDPHIAASRKLDFFGYDLVTPLGQSTHEHAHELIKLLGVKTNSLNKFCPSLEEVTAYHADIMKRRPHLPYETDGIVVNVNNIALFERVGVAGKAPRGMIAFKFPGLEATTIVREVEWNVGRTGTITPVAVMDPTAVGGVTITHASLHNMDEIGRLGLKIGDTVIVQRAGDVIPKVVKVMVNLRTGDEKAITPPKQCPRCSGLIIHKVGEVAMYCENRNCFAQERERILHFASRKAFDIQGLGDKIAEQLLQQALIADASDLFTLTVGDLESLERFAEKSAHNLVAAIQKSKNIALHRFLYALGILHVGEETARVLANKISNFEFRISNLIQNSKFRIQNLLKVIQGLSVQQLQEMPDIGPVVAQSIYTWFHDPQHVTFLEKLDRAGIMIKHQEVKKSGSQALQGKTFVFTGELKAMSREQVQEKVRQLGGIPTSSVSKNTSYVVAGPHTKTFGVGAGDKRGRKYEAAKRLGVKIINEEEFLTMI